MSLLRFGGCRYFVCIEFLEDFLQFIEERPKLRHSIYLLVMVVVGVLFFAYHYDEAFTRSLYWVIITGLGVGFGDVHPTDTAGYWFSVFYIYLLVIVAYTFMATVCRRDSEVKNILSKTLNADLIKTLDKTKDGYVCEWEYDQSQMTPLFSAQIWI